MSEGKDPKIKLFGKTIELPENSGGVDSGQSCDPDSSSLVQSGDFNEENNTEEQESRKNLPIPKPDDAEKENEAQGESKDPNDDPQAENDPNAPADKTLKKPDKLLPCPRCNSIDTKFCYFNNYNVSQPRHFCKNCQRYWTAGGTMRNVPVGAGRRKNKNAASQFRHVSNPEFPSVAHAPLCESMASVLSIADNALQNQEKGGGDSGDKRGKTVISQNSMPTFPWPYHFPPGGYPMPFYGIPTPYWGVAVPSVNWVMGHTSPTLGKHSRDESENIVENLGNERNPENNLWVPKTLRIDDPREAAMSSIWATLGIKNEGADSKGENGLFKNFRGQSKKSEKTATSSVQDNSSVLQANPAAQARSLSFHEKS